MKKKLVTMEIELGEGEESHRIELTWTVDKRVCLTTPNRNPVVLSSPAEAKELHAVVLYMFESNKG